MNGYHRKKLWQGWQRYGTVVWLGVLISWYLLATLPHLADFPFVETAQMGIAAPAYKLASQGIYGNDLYRGLYHAEIYNYEYMPLYPLAIALTFKLMGLGVWQARLVSVWCGLAVMLLTFCLGKTTINTQTGLLAATALCLLPLTITGTANDLYPGAIPLLDFARVLRYDVMTPVWVLAACLSFLWAIRLNRASGYFVAGFISGWATLSHLYGSFILTVFVILLFWQEGWAGWRSLLLIFLGWTIPLLPWLAYVLQDLPAYQGQMLRHESRFDLWNLGFYLDNLLREPWRYVKFLGRFRQPILWPRPGFWLMIFTVSAAYVHLCGQLRQRRYLPNFFLLITLPTLTLMLAILVSFKRYTYVVLLMPFLAIHIGLGITVLWRWGQRSGRIWAGLVSLLILTATVEGVVSVANNLQVARSATPYRELTTILQQTISPDARILMLHDYWLGLVEYDVYSIDLAYNLSDSSFVGAAARPLPQVIQQINPTHVIVPQHLLKSYLTPEKLPDEKVVNFWRLLDGTVQKNCPEAATPIQSHTYGTINVYQCYWPVTIIDEP